MDEQDSCEVGRTAPITVAGRTIGNPFITVTGYLKEHPGTVRHYDFIAGTSGEVTAELVKARLLQDPTCTAGAPLPTRRRARLHGASEAAFELAEVSVDGHPGLRAAQCGRELRCTP